MTSSLQSNKENQVSTKTSLPSLGIVIQELNNRSNQRIGEIALSNYPTISRLVNKYSYGETLVVINELILSSIVNLNLGKQMNVEQIKKCAEDLMGQYHTYKLDDFKKCLNEGIKGTYNPEGFFDRLDISIIFGWFKIYDMQRDEAIIVERSKQASEKKITPMNIDDKVLSAFVTSSKPKEIKEGVEIIEKPLTEVQQWYKDFDSLYKLGGRDSGGIRMVEMDYKWMNIDSYLNFRIEQKINK